VKTTGGIGLIVIRD